MATKDDILRSAPTGQDNALRGTSQGNGQPLGGQDGTNPAAPAVAPIAPKKEPAVAGTASGQLSQWQGKELTALGQDGTQELAVKGKDEPVAESAAVLEPAGENEKIETAIAATGQVADAGKDSNDNKIKGNGDKTGDKEDADAGKVANEGNNKEVDGDDKKISADDGKVDEGEKKESDDNLTLVELYKKLYGEPTTDEELAKERKKQKREQLFAAIGDGIAALSNLYFTTQYAPNMYTGKDTMSERIKIRYDKLKKERDGKKEAYYNGMMKAMLADQAKAKDDRNWLRQTGLDEYKKKRDEAKDERDKQLFDLNVQLQNHKISAAEAEAKRKGIEAKYAEDLEKAKLDTERARSKAQRASASASSARAKYYNNGGSGGKGGKPGEYPWYDKNGGKHYAHSYEAMRQNAIDNGTWNDMTQESTTEVKSGRGKTMKKSETTRPGKGHSYKPATSVNSNKYKHTSEIKW